MIPPMAITAAEPNSMIALSVNLHCGTVRKDAPPYIKELNVIPRPNIRGGRRARMISRRPLMSHEPFDSIAVIRYLRFVSYMIGLPSS